jgi:hypothetical protein
MDSTYGQSPTTKINSTKRWFLHNVGPPDRFTIEKREGGQGARGEVKNRLRTFLSLCLS